MKKISVLLLLSILISLFSNVATAYDNVENEESVEPTSQSDVNIEMNSDDSEGFIANSMISYGVTPENDVTLLLGEKTSFDAFKEKLGSDLPITITRNGSEILSDDIIKTGDLISINGDESIAEVVGDVDGDGLITTTDYLRLKSFILGEIGLESACYSAGDTDNNGAINSTDYYQIKSYCLKRFNFFDAVVEVEEESLSEQIFLPKCDPDFSFLVSFDGDLTELQQNVKIYNVVDDTNVVVNYSAELEESSIYKISPETTYENYEIYTVELTGNASFVDYKAKSISFEIGGPDKNDIDLENNIIFLKNLEKTSPGYYPYTIIYDEEKELYILTLSKGDGINDAFIGKILAVGDYSSEEEVLADSSKELYFGKIQKIYSSGENTVIEMIAPEIDELFSTLDVFTNQYSGDMTIEFNEDLENEIVGAIQESDAFVEHIAAANLAAQDYALEHGVVAVDVVGKSFKDYFKFELSKKEFKHHDGGYCTVNIEGKLTCTIPLKTTSGTDVGNIKITCTAGVKSDIWFYGHCNTKDMHLGITTKTTVELGFNLTIKAEASLNDEMHYYVNKKTGTIHTGTCRYVNKVTDVTNLDVYTAKSLLNLYSDKEAMKKDECKVCKAVSGLDGTTYVVNLSSNTLHCLNCVHVSTIANHNVFETYPERVDGYTLCADCRPQDREAKDFEQRMLNRMQGGDWAAEVETLRSLMKNSGNNESGNGKGMDIGEVPFNFLGVFDFRLTLELVCNFDLEATLDCTFTFYSEDQFGVWVDHKNSSTYHNQVDKWDKQTIDVTGKVDLELGINLHISASIIGLKDCISVYLDAGAGMYATLSGVLHFESGTAEKLNNYYAAYFEMGFYYDISGGFKLFKRGKEITIIEDRIPLLKRGYERAYYSFKNYSPSMDITWNYTNLGNSDVLNVEYLNVKGLKKGTATLKPEGDSQYSVKYVFKNADGTINPYLTFGQGGIKVSADAPETFTANMEITVVPKYAPVSSISEFISQEYKNESSIFFLDTLTVALNVKVLKNDSDSIGDSSEGDDFPNFGDSGINYDLGSLKANLTDGVLTIWGEGAMTDYSSSSNVPWYDEKGEITNVVIKNGVTSIGKYAFYYCNSLVSINIPDSVTNIGSYAFYYCTSLASITIPDSVTSIGSYAFRSCKSLVSINIPDNVTSIGDYAFDNCNSLVSINIPDSVTSIGNYAFRSCKSLANITIGKGVTSIRSGAFEDCDSLTSVIIGDSVTSIGNYAFRSCKSLANVTIGKGVTSIGSGAFEDCDSLTSVTILDSVTSIGSGAFSGCDVLSSVTIGDSVTSIGSNAFSNCLSIVSIIIPDSVTSIGSSAFSNCPSIASIAIPDSVTSIGSGAFSGCDSLESMVVSSGNKVYHSMNNCLIETETKTLIAGFKNSVIPADGSVTSIGDDAFYYCTSLVSITIPDSVTSIGYRAFCSCDALESIAIPDNVTSIGNFAFSGCDVLSSVTIGDSVTSIGSYAFYSCDVLANVTIGDSVTSIGSYAFSNCPSIVSIIIPDSVTSIGDYAFEDCDSLESITIPDSVTSIGNYAFRSCKSLANVTIGKGVTSIGSGAFEDCDALESVIIGDNVTSIGSYAFSDCDVLANVTIGDSVTSIGDFAFSNCDVLANVTIGDSVTSIGDYAFSYCPSLVSITIPDSVTSIGEEAFYNCDALESVTFENPNGWYVSASRNVTVTDKSTAADYLTVKYNNYYWYRK